MTILEILKKLLESAGENHGLGEEDLTLIQGFDPQKAADDAAAGAKRATTADLDKKHQDAVTALNTQLEEIKTQLAAKTEEGDTSKTDMQKLQESMTALQTGLEERDAKLAEADEKAKVTSRNSTIDKMFDYTLVPNVSRDMARADFGNVLKDVSDEDLGNQEVTDPIREVWDTANAGIIMDTSGEGSGGTPKGSTQPSGGAGGAKPTMANRRAELKKRRLAR